MTERSYRVTVRGRFGALDDGQRTELLAQQHLHDMFAAKFTAEGVFLYERELVGFQFRYELTSSEVTAEDAELEVAMIAEELTARHLSARGINGRIVQVALANLADVKIRQQRQKA